MPGSERGRPLPCRGWWEQVSYGRQPMDPLTVAVTGRRLDGRGSDVVGAFALEGFIAADGRVSVEKRYLGRHSVIYEGQCDGEGRLWGVWALAGFNGRWLIELGRSMTDDDHIDPLVPRAAT